MNQDQIVFISYTHDSQEHKKRVLQLADKLRAEGIDCHLDQYEDSPPEGWARWMVNQVKQASFVLTVCTENYERRFEGHEIANKGLGAQWEGAVITQDLYDNAAHNTKFIPILFSNEDSRFIPTILKSATYYRVDSDEGYEDLYRRLTDQRRVVKPSLGEKRVLPAVNFQQQSQANQNAIARHRDVEPSNDAAPRSNNNLLLIYVDENTKQFISASQVVVEEKIEVRLRPENSRQKAFLTDLAQRNRDAFGVAYKDNAWLVRLEKNVQNHNEAEEWQLVLNPQEDNRSSSLIMEMNINGYTGDDFAELRARRILLNEQIENRDLRNRGSLDAGMIQHTVRRGSGFITEIYSPIPALYNEYKNDIPRFLDTVRLMCVLFLQLNRVVKHILTLELKFNDSNEINVEFEGQRERQYSNQQPYTIKFSGICSTDSFKQN